MENEIETELFIAGDGPLRQALEAKSRGVKSIRWLGHIDQKEILKRLSESRALIFPTKCFEGQPLILLEAMSVGCPVITSRIGNPKNLIDDGQNGLHFKTGSIDELFSRIRMLSEYEEQARRMGRKARETYLETYTPEANYSRMTEIYAKAHEWEKKLSEGIKPV
jgi:glycosyltransferase involved in cell wall biosynthesis